MQTECRKTWYQCPSWVKRTVACSLTFDYIPDAVFTWFSKWHGAYFSFAYFLAFVLNDWPSFSNFLHPLTLTSGQCGLWPRHFICTMWYIVLSIYLVLFEPSSPSKKGKAQHFWWVSNWCCWGAWHRTICYVNLLCLCSYMHAFYAGGEVCGIRLNGRIYYEDGLWPDASD